jgi:hypothetical protein
MSFHLQDLAYSYLEQPSPSLQNPHRTSSISITPKNGPTSNASVATPSKGYQGYEDLNSGVESCSKLHKWNHRFDTLPQQLELWI